MDEAAQILVDSVLARLRELVGKAWVEPQRVDLMLRAKWRPEIGDDVRWFGSATMTFERAVVTYEFNLGERISSRARG